MIKSRIIKLKNMFFDFMFFVANRQKTTQLASKSLLWPLKEQNHEQQKCPLCQKGEFELFFDLPLGWPMPQNDHLLYYDYENQDMELLVENRSFIERTSGFLISLPWNFCPECKNTVLGVQFSQRHLNSYYSKYYQRMASSTEKRKNTKQRHAQYINSLIKRNSRVLEIGSAEGYAARYLADQGHSVWAVEPAKFRENLHDKNIAVVDSIAELKNDYFDCIYLHHVLEHIVDIPEFLTASYRMLKKEGLLVIQVPDISLQIDIYLKSLRWCHFSFTNPYKYNRSIARRFFPQARNVFYWLDVFDNSHIYAFSPFGLQYLLTKADFKVNSIQQTTKERLMFNNSLNWPVDRENGQTPNGVTVVANK